MKKQMLSEAQIQRMARIAGIPVIGGIVSEKLDIQAEDTTDEVAEETEATNEEVAAEEEEMEMDAAPEMEEPAEEEVSQDKIESLVDAVLAAIESETGVPAERVDAAAEEEEEAPAEEPEMEEPEMEEPEMEMGEEEPETEMMEEATPSLAERIAQAVQAVIDEDTAIAEGTEEDVAEDATEEAPNGTSEEQLEEITKAVVARLRSLKQQNLLVLV